MYKIMFVDDEALILRRLHQVLDWESLGFQVLPDSTDGNMAWKQIQACSVDVIICDINMPDMDGLTLIQKVKQAYPKVQCILLTVNDSFGCAQQALNIGVDHYLLKPINPPKLAALIEKIRQRLEFSIQETEYVTSLKDRALLSEKMIREKFLNWLVTGRQPLDDEQLKEKFRFYHIPIQAQSFQILSVHINSFESHLLSESNMEDLVQTAVKTIEDSLSEYSNWVVFSDSFYNLNILLGFQNDYSILGPSINFIAQMLREYLLFQLNLPVTIFYSQKYQGLHNIYRCYYETKFLCQYTSAVMGKGVLSFDEYIRTSLDSSFDFDTLRLDTLKLLRSGACTELKQHVSAVLSRSLRIGSFEGFNMLRIDFVMTGIMFLQENKVGIQDIFQKHFSPLTEVLEQNDAEQCSLFLDAYFEKIVTYVQANKISSRHRISEKCMELIAQNIASPDLSVKWLGSQLYINENYLSRVFKSETGTAIIKYIMNQRMETAKHYLDQGYSNLQQVSQMVGFADPLYFSKCFKKQYGVAPSKYGIK